MPRISVLQVFTFLLLVSACVYVANHVARYLLRVDGGYSEWSGFNECSRTCGGGIRLRRRVCSNPYPRLGGHNCSILGKPIQVFKCNRNPCAVNGGYGNWLAFEPCSLTCGEGTKTRRRKCDQPLPKYGGKNCKEMELGEDTETAKCNERKCPVHGGYSEWSNFGDCSVTCGGGNKTRSRECNNPKPDLDGKNCTGLGPNEEKSDCNTKSCPTIPPTTKPPTTTPPTTKPPATKPPTTKPPTTKPPATKPPATKPAETKNRETTTKSSKFTDVKSQSSKEQNKESELNPTTSVSSRDSDFTEIIPTFAEGISDEPRNDTFTS